MHSCTNTHQCIPGVVRCVYVYIVLYTYVLQVIVRNIWLRSFTVRPDNCPSASSIGIILPSRSLYISRTNVKDPAVMAYLSQHKIAGHCADLCRRMDMYKHRHAPMYFYVIYMKQTGYCSTYVAAYKRQLVVCTCMIILQYMCIDVCNYNTQIYVYIYVCL